MNNIETQVNTLVSFQDKLVPGAVKVAMKDSGAKSSDLYRVPPSALKVREGYNPRIETPDFLQGLQALADNMKVEGFYDSKPIAVSVAIEDGTNVLYVEDGHRRLRAVLLAIGQGADIATVPVTVMPRSTNEVDRLVHMVHSNNDGEKFKPLELGIIISRMHKLGIDEADIAKRLGMTTTYVRQLSSLMSAPKAIRDMVKDGEISATLAIETVAEHKGEAEELLKEAQVEAKVTGKKVTGKAVKKVAAKKAAKKTGKSTIAALSEKSIKLQKKHGVEAFALLKEIFDKHGKVIDTEFHTRADALLFECGVI